MCKAHTISRTGDRSRPFRSSARKVSTSSDRSPTAGLSYTDAEQRDAFRGVFPGISPPPYEGKYVHAKQRDTFGAIFPGMASHLPARTRAELLQNSQHRHEQRHYNEANTPA
jgi:hypothetical protein